MSTRTETQAQRSDVVISRLEARGLDPQAIGAGQWRSRCPSHRGTSKNLSISEGTDGTVLLHCHHRDGHGNETCSAAAIAAALDLQLSDLFPANGEHKHRNQGSNPARKAAPPRARESSRPHRSPEHAIAGAVRRHGEPVAVWIYPDEDGHELLRVYRFNEQDGGKQFRPVHPEADGWHLGDPGGPLPLYGLDRLRNAPSVYVLEGEKCADLARDLGAVATTSSHGSSAPQRTDWSPLAGKDVTIVPDNDEPGRGYAKAVAQILAKLEPKPRIRIVALPLEQEGDDIAEWLTALPRHWSPADRLHELTRLRDATPTWSPPPPADNPPGGGDNEFGNFSARIISEIIRHEDDVTSRYVELEAVHQDGTVVTAIIKAQDFESMNWVVNELGMKFVVNAGRNSKDRFQQAIRLTSLKQGIRYRHIFTSLGWARIGGKDIYLHAGGSIGPCVSEVEVECPPQLAKFSLPTPDRGRFSEAVRRILSIGERLGKDAPAVAAIVTSLPFRALLGPSRTIAHFYGTSGSRKTSMACLAARFFAPSLGFKDPMPLSWSATSAGLERLRHCAKDTLVVIDNLIADDEQARRELMKADQVVNSQGDLMGKGRSTPDGTMRARLDPRGSFISTGECQLNRRSASGRTISIEFKPEMIKLEQSDPCHRDASEGWYAQAIACYAAYLADGRLEEYRGELKRLADKHQLAALDKCAGCHPRHAEAVAEWTAGWELFLRFAVEAGAITQPEASEAAARVREHLFESLSAQAHIQEESDPAEVFLELLGSLLASKRAVLYSRDGLAPTPDLAGPCGWQRVELPQRDGRTVPGFDKAYGAAMVGWIDDEYVWLEPNASYAAVERHARELDRSLGRRRQVHARLAETGKSITDKAGEGTRRFSRLVTIEGIRRRCICIRRSDLIEFEGEVSSSADASESESPY